MSYIVDKEEIKLVTLPEETGSYKPVSHNAAVQLLVDRLDLEGFKVSSEKYLLSKGGNVMSFKLGVERNETFRNNDPLDRYGEGVALNNKTQRLMFAGLNSYDKSTRLAYAAGTQVMVCHNGMISGSIYKLRKHTKNVFRDIDELLDIVVTEGLEEYEKNVRFARILNNSRCNKDQASRILGHLVFNEKIISTTESSKVWKEFNNNTEFGSDTKWDLYNACTEVFKGVRPDQTMKKHADLHKYFSKYTMPFLEINIYG